MELKECRLVTSEAPIQCGIQLH